MLANITIWLVSLISQTLCLLSCVIIDNIFALKRYYDSDSSEFAANLSKMAKELELKRSKLNLCVCDYYILISCSLRCCDKRLMLDFKRIELLLSCVSCFDFYLHKRDYRIYFILFKLYNFVLVE